MDFLGNINVQFYMIGYLVGGIPFGLLLAKFFANMDIRSGGSGSIGATNVLRVLKQTNPVLAKRLAIATLLLDALKGMAVIVGAKILSLSPETQWAIACFSVIGHCYSPYLKFEGGKGVATAAGVLSIMLPLPMLIALIVWLACAKGLKISSLSSLLGLVTLIASSYMLEPTLGELHTHAPVWIIAFIIVYKHIPNIIRLFKGEEARVVS